MSRYPLDTRFWTDKAVARLDAGAKLIAAYALTGPQTNRIGFFVFDLPKAAQQLGVSIDEPFRRVQTELQWKYDEWSRVLLIPAWWRYHNPGNPKALIGYSPDFCVLPPNTLVSDFARVSRQLLGGRWPAFAEACGIQVEAPPGEVQEFFPLDAYQQFIAYFVEAWSKHHGGAKYAFTAGRDGTAAKRILDHVQGDLDKTKKIVDLYFEERDDWTRNKGSTLSILSTANRLNEYVAKMVDGGKSEFDKEWERKYGDG